MMEETSGNGNPEQPRPSAIDLRGSGKTVSVHALAKVVDALKPLHPGESIELFTDPYDGLRNDIMAWGRMSGKEVHRLDKQNESYDHFIITKTNLNGDNPAREKVAIILSSNGLEELLSPLGFALAAATVGMDVAIFFQGPATHVLRKGFKGRLSNPFQAPFSCFARRGMADMGHDPPAKKLQLLHDLGAKFYACHPSMDHFGVKQSQLAFDDVILAEYATFLEAMRGANIQLYP